MSSWWQIDTLRFLHCRRNQDTVVEQLAEIGQVCAQCQDKAFCVLPRNTWILEENREPHACIGSPFHMQDSCRIHEALRATPAKAVAVTQHVRDL